MKKIIILLTILLAGCTHKSTSIDQNPSPISSFSPKASPIGQVTFNNTREDIMTITKATIKTNKGDINVRLFPDKAPKTVSNFAGLATGSQEWVDPKTGEQKTNTPLYQNLTFHRVIPDFMIQGGDPMGNGTGGPGYAFEDEVGTGIKFDKPGLLAMANSGPNTNGSQFFITHVSTPWLNDKHTIFGEVVSEQDQKIVDSIRQGDKIISIEIESE